MEDLVVLPDDRVALILTAPIEIDKGGMSILEVKKKAWAKLADSLTIDQWDSLINLIGHLPVR